MSILRTTLLQSLPRLTRRASRGFVLACVLGTAGLAHAQLFDDVDWKETEVPPAPAFNPDNMIPIEMPRFMSLKFGVDPSTIKITGDGVVRYVVIAINRDGGGFNAFYDGLRCATEEQKTYARFSNGAWESTRDPEWRHFTDRSSRHTYALATQGLCRGHAPRASVGEMVRFLKAPIREVE